MVSETTLSLLRAFDRLNLTRLRGTDLFAAAGTDAAAAGSSLANLVSSGHLREINGQYERTEFGRLETAGPLELTLLTRAGCHLCEQALRQIEPLLPRTGARLRLVDVDGDRILRERYGNEIPVLFLGRREVARHRIDAGTIRAALRDTKP